MTLVLTLLLLFAGTGKIKSNPKVKNGGQECPPYTHPCPYFFAGTGKIKSNPKVKSGGQECPPYIRARLASLAC